MGSEKTFSKCKEKKINVVFGSPIKNSYSGSIKYLNWEHIDDICSYDLKQKINTFRFAKMLKKINAFSSYVSIVKKMLPNYITHELTEFLNDTINYHRILRNEAYLYYKDSPNKFFNIDTLVLRVELSDVFGWVTLAIRISFLKKYFEN